MSDPGSPVTGTITPADLGGERRRLVCRPGAVPTLSGRRGLVDERRLGRHDLALLRLLRHDDGHRRPLRLPRGRDRRRGQHRQLGHDLEPAASTTPRRARRRPSPPRAGATTPPAGTRAAARTASAARTRDAGSGVQKVEISIRRNTGNYWSARLVQLGQRGLEHDLPLGRQLVVHLPRLELPRRRHLHHPRAGDGQRQPRRDAEQPLVHVRHRRSRHVDHGQSRRPDDRRRARASASRRPRAARPSSASSTAAATPRARARRATRARSPTGATRSSCARPIPPATRTALQRATRGRSTPPRLPRR